MEDKEYLMEDEQPLLVFVQSKLNPDAENLFAEYLTRSRALMEEYGVEVIASGIGVEHPQAHEVWPRNSLLRYPSLRAFQRYMTDPRYPELKAIRERAYAANKVSMFTPPTPDPRSVALRAFHHFCAGLASGEWEPFLGMLSDDFHFWFPRGQYKGLNTGKDRAREFFTYVSSVFAEGLTVTLDRVIGSGSTYVFEFRDEGKLRGQPYANRVAIALDVRGHQICAYREYFGLDI
ncbi:nuclear transport factor 2 family protein [Roseiflexus sp.]|uniref:nuclear transport factor 2 family protein n=1 Tax=Roseiflexus sp. TaxID=2562120 RepID=UPI00398BBC19